VRLNLGCGHDILAGWVNVDASDRLGGPPLLVVWDLDVLPWPWDDMTASEIRGIDIFEHVNDPVGFVSECHRILEPGGMLRLQTGYYLHQDAYTDPTHKRFPTEHTFDFWIPGNVLYDAQNAQMGGAAFEKIRVKPNHQTGQLDVILRRPDA
jgi:predicted SAM-dependent methyltransferase